MSDAQLLQVRLDLLDDGPNVRRRADADLKRSIAEHGVLQPITICRRGERYEVLYGHRRTAAARALRLETIPAILVAAPDDLPIRQIVENLHRRAVDPLDIGRALRAHLEANPGLSRTDLAKALGRSLPWVSGKLELLELEAETQRRVAAGELSEANAIAGRRERVRFAEGRPRTLPGLEEGRSRSISVPLGLAPNRRPITATVGIDETGAVDLVIDNGQGSSTMVSLDGAAARLLARRLAQAAQAVQVAS